MSCAILSFHTVETAEKRHCILCNSFVNLTEETKNDALPAVIKKRENIKGQC